VAGAITASEPSWTAPFTGLSPRVFAQLVRTLRREGVDTTRPGRPWSLPLEDRVLLVAAYWRTRIELANAIFEYLEIFHSGGHRIAVSRACALRNDRGRCGPARPRS
jgi:hypothetical protein